MRDSVANAFWDFTKTREGYLKFMYADVKNLVTTGMGNLIDPVSAALALPWKHGENGPFATQDEIIAAWNAVKNRTDLNQKGGGYYAGVTDLRLNDDDVKNLVTQKLQQNEDQLRQRYPAYDSWPADAQLGLLSMAWAAGPAFNFPAFKSAVNSIVPDFRKAAQESHMKGLNADRQTANYQLFMNAADVLDQGANPDVLYWPNSVIEGAKTAAKVGIGFYGSGLIIGGGFLAYHLLKNFITRNT